MKPTDVRGRSSRRRRWSVGRARNWGCALIYSCLTTWLSGCATSADPHQGGFVSGVVGLAGGGYQRRVDEREGVYRDELDAQQRLKAQARALEEERAAVKGDLGRAQARLANQQSRIARERARLGAERQSSAAALERLRLLEQAQAKANRTKGELGAATTSDQSVADLRARSEEIQKELDQIDRMVGVVSGTQF